MKVKFTCPCGESFNIKVSNFGNKTSIVCQNCGLEFPKDKFPTLKGALLQLEQISGDLDKSNNSNDIYESLPHWKFEL